MPTPADAAASVGRSVPRSSARPNPGTSGCAVASQFPGRQRWRRPAWLEVRYVVGAPPPQRTVSIVVRATLNALSPGAEGEMQAAIQAYADRLVRESEKQEISNQAPGVMFPEIGSSSVARAREILSKFGSRARPSRPEVMTLIGLPICSGAAGVFGSYLHSVWQVASFAGSAFMGVVSVVYLAARRLL
jgi:hypothetical protein